MKEKTKDERLTMPVANLILISIGFVTIVVGFLLMTGSATEVKFNPDIFSFRRVVIAPIVAFVGFIFVIFAILFKKRTKK